MPCRGRAVERDVQRFPEPRHRRTADRAALRGGQGQRLFDGPGKDEDFGLEQITGDPADRYKFRTSPLRNRAPGGILPQRRFTRLDDAIRHHLDVFSSARSYNPLAAGLDSDLT